jgi:hypothetical protein
MMLVTCFPSSHCSNVKWPFGVVRRGFVVIRIA